MFLDTPIGAGIRTTEGQVLFVKMILRNSSIRKQLMIMLISEENLNKYSPVRLTEFMPKLPNTLKSRLQDERAASNVFSSM